MSQLQRCQNNAARIVSLGWKYDHITPVLKDLHWLPVEYRMNYKILLLAYKAQHGMAPPYLSSLLSPYKPGRSLRSEGKYLLTTPCYRLEGFGKCCFACRPFSLEHAPHLHQVCPVQWHFQEQSEDTSVKCRIFILATWHFYHIVCIFPASVWCLSDIISAFERNDLSLLKLAL